MSDPATPAPEFPRPPDIPSPEALPPPPPPIPREAVRWPWQILPLLAGLALVVGAYLSWNFAPTGGPAAPLNYEPPPPPPPAAPAPVKNDPNPPQTGPPVKPPAVKRDDPPPSHADDRPPEPPPRPPEPPPPAFPLVSSLKAPDAQVRCLAFSADGRYYATGGTDQMVRVADARTGKEKAACKHTPMFPPRGAFDQSAAVVCVAFNPDGDRVASVGDVVVKVWSVESGDLLFTLTPQFQYVRRTVFSRDGKRLASGGLQSVTIWNAETGREIRTFAWHGSYVTDMAFGVDDRVIAVAGDNGTLQLLDVETGDVKLDLRGHDLKSCPVSTALSPDGGTLAAGSWAWVKLRDADTGKLLHKLDQPQEYVHSLAFAPDGKWLAVGTDRHVTVWNAAEGKSACVLEAGDRAMAVAFTPDGKELLMGGEKGGVRIWDMKDLDRMK